MMNTILQKTITPGILNIILNRPDKGNALDESMILELTKLLTHVSFDEDVKVVILSSNGKHFCTGADLAWMQKMVNYTLEENLQDAKQLAAMYQAFNDFTKPIITCVQGATYGGGLGLIACADIALAAPNSTYCFSEVKLGLVPATIAPYVINTIGLRQAKRYFLTAEVFDASEAKNMNLIHQVVSEDQLLKTAITHADNLLNNSSSAIKKCKQLIRDIHPISREITQLTSECIANSRTTEDAQNRLREFLKGK
jgi:methylglutaconyl-CoA hydratase